MENSSTVQEQEMNKKLNKFLVYNELINQLKLLTINLASTWTTNHQSKKEMTMTKKHMKVIVSYIIKYMSKNWRNFI